MKDYNETVTGDCKDRPNGEEVLIGIRFHRTYYYMTFKEMGQFMEILQNSIAFRPSGYSTSMEFPPVTDELDMSIKTREKLQELRVEHMLLQKEEDNT